MSARVAATRPRGTGAGRPGLGDTVVLRNGQRVRLVQIDTPEVFFGRECYGRAASLRTKTLLPLGVRLSREHASCSPTNRPNRILSSSKGPFF